MKRSTLVALTGVMTMILTACGGSPAPSKAVKPMPTENKPVQTQSVKPEEKQAPETHADASDAMGGMNNSDMTAPDSTSTENPSSSEEKPATAQEAAPVSDSSN